MEFTGAAVKTHQEAIKAPERFENQQERPIDAVQDFASRLSRAVDVSIIDFLNNIVGPAWEMSRVLIEQVYPDGYSNEIWNCYYILYDGRRIGRIRYATVSHGMKIIANLYVELVEEVIDGEIWRA